MANMNWYSILSGAKLLGTATVIVGVIAIVSIGGVKQTKRRIAEYKKSGRFLDLLKIFSKY
jgi:ABC-type transport system involved in cytochrome bd biosynthesis fused ATPase/permease subunit